MRNPNAVPTSATVRTAGVAAACAAAYAAVVRVVERGAGPAVDLAIRLWIAQACFVSGLLKLVDWSNALYLATYEYPVPWLSPATAAALGVTVELAGAALLALGLATRVAAAAIGLLALVVQLEYRQLDGNLVWMALGLWYVVHGAGPISLDRLLARGLEDSALPFAGAILRGYRATTRTLGPVARLLLRGWMGGAILVALAGAGAAEAWLPVASARGFATPCAAALAVALIAGLATRAASLALLAIAMGTQAMVGGEAALWVPLLALLATAGGGSLALDALAYHALRRRYPQLDGKPAFSLDGLPQVVIVGAGFGGLACAAALARARVAVTLVDRHNYHLFQPLLYQVATASLSPGDIATPIRTLFRDHFNVRVLLGEVVGVDKLRREVRLAAGTLRYDYLVLATGAAHGYFGRDEWAPYAPGLKRVEDATEIRRRLLSAFERAEATDDPDERASLLTFLVVGGGPTGVELAGAIAELARYGLAKEFRRFDPAQARIVLVQAAPRLLPTFPEPLAGITQRALERIGVEVRLRSRVEAIDDAGVTVDGQRIRSRTVLWAAGVSASPAAAWLDAEADNAGRVKVGADLSVPAHPEIFVVGDTAFANAWNGNAVPGLAPAAKQGGAYVAGRIRARVEGRRDPGPFVYRHVGSLATIGRKAAVVDLGGLRLSGALAWWFWGALHVGFLIGLRNRVSVMFDWLWSYLTYSGGTRLITGVPPPPVRQESAT